MILIEKPIRINQTLIKFLYQNLIEKNFIAIMIAIENVIRINQTLI